MDKIYQERFQSASKRLFKYLPYIFNDHFVIVVLFIMGALAFQYSQWLKTLTVGEPLAQFLLIVFFFLAIKMPQVKTYLKEADLVFLLPWEEHFSSYFKRAVGYSMLLPVFILALVCLLAYPYLSVVFAYSWLEIMIVYFSLLVLKVFDFLQFFNQRRLANHPGWQAAFTHIVILVTLVLALGDYPWLALILALSALILTKYYTKSNLDFPSLLASELKRQQGQNRMLAMFVDIPAGQQKIKRRSYLDFLLRPVKDNIYAYLYQRAFLRSTEVLPIWLRLTILAGLIAGLMTDTWLKLIIIVLITYAANFQLQGLLGNYRRHTMVRLQPQEASDALVAFQSFLRGPIMVQTIIITVIFLLRQAYYLGMSFCLACLIFYLVFAYLYLKRRFIKTRKMV
ncbi:hypothetical protein AWM75_06155 [Aerococcus urinaehominis]|uniref:Uncharacterized protein n=1 Tax=Aerococcus urinaehominis TaxID=128944 RepID=A0A0X8FLM0_9LACT|nr:ABC transporter permease [Aerococcus urinaehominis]AMB99587.1 hypothetical protein AWM75_06155 [Aerococcus urinaehominis]SDL86531.1 ABC-2 type transport system permease protein [Aerococcus urinaehominis]